MGYTETQIRLVGQEIVEQRVDIAPNGLGDEEVYVKMTHCGLCYTDIEVQAWGRDITLGHEPVGIVAEVGKNCRFIKVGDRVGWGWRHDSCGNCDSCIGGSDHHCSVDLTSVYGGPDVHLGGLSTGNVLRENWVQKLPDGLSSAEAAPLFCAGVTVFSALLAKGVNGTSKCGVVGIGGLGHLLLQYLHKMGCYTVAFTSNASKYDEAKEFGANEVVITKSSDFGVITPLDYIFFCGSGSSDYVKYLELLSPFGQLVGLGVQYGEAVLPYMNIIIPSKSFTGNSSGSRLQLRQTLRFSAENNVAPVIEKVPFSLNEIKTSLSRLKNGDVRYRFVVEF